MKKKSIVSILIVWLLIILASLSPRMVFADTTYPEQPPSSSLGSVVSVGTNGLNDSMLYYKLTEVYNAYYGLGQGTRIDELRQFMFRGMDFSYFDGVLNLSGGGVTTLEGLDLIDFSQCTNLTTLKLNGNSLTTITAKATSGLSRITNLDISKNNLSSVDLSSFENLSTLNASDNKLSGVKLTFMNTDSGEAYVNLVGNPIDNILNVEFKREGLLTNNINLYVVNKLQTTEYLGNSKIKVQAGLTGLQSDEKYTSLDKLTYNKISNIAGLNMTSSDIVMHIVDYDDPSIAVIDPIINSSVEESVDIFSKINFGKYMIYFTDEVGAKISNQVSAFVDKFDGITVEYVPASPTIQVSSNGEEVDFKSGKILRNDSTFTFVTTDLDASFYYKLGADGEWQSGASILLKAEHKDTLYIKSVINGIESDITAIEFGEDTRFGMQELLTIGLVALGILALFFILIPVVRYFIFKPINLKEKSKKDKE